MNTTGNKALPRRPRRRAPWWWPASPLPTAAATTTPPRPDDRGSARRRRRRGLLSSLCTAPGVLQAVPAGGLRPGGSWELRRRAGERPRSRQRWGRGTGRGCASSRFHMKRRACSEAAPRRVRLWAPAGASWHVSSTPGRAGPPVTREAAEPPRPPTAPPRLSYVLPRCLHSPGSRARSEVAALRRRPQRSPGHRQPAGGRRAVPVAGSAREATRSESGGTGPCERAAPEPLTCSHLPAALPHSSPPDPAATCGAGPARSRGAKGEAGRQRCPGAAPR